VTSIIFRASVVWWVDCICERRGGYFGQAAKNLQRKSNRDVHYENFIFVFRGGDNMVGIAYRLLPGQSGARIPADAMGFFFYPQ
jgi:hypothetical protein